VVLAGGAKSYGFHLGSFNADFRGRENNQAFGGLSPPFSGDFFIPLPRSLIVFPAQHGAIGFVSAFAEL
jgi:hypothetical protein